MSITDTLNDNHPSGGRRSHRPARLHRHRHPHAQARGRQAPHGQSRGKQAVDAARRYVDSPISELRDIIRLDWDAMDAWFEEDEGVYTHPRDPYTRVDILTSSRRVRVEVDGVVLAESTGARVLFETGLPPRWYLPKI